MPARSEAYHQDVVQAVVPAQKTASENGPDVDLKGFDAATIIANVGAVAAAGISLKLQEADDDGAGAPDVYADVDAGDLVGAFAALAANTPQKVGYIGTKRWIRVVVTDAATGDATLGAVVVRTKAAHNA